MAIGSRETFLAFSFSDQTPLLLPPPPPISIVFTPSGPLKTRSLTWDNTQKKEKVLSVSESLGSLRGGTGLLECPTTKVSDPQPPPQTQEGGSREGSTSKKCTGAGDRYRVLLVDNEGHTEKLVEEKLPLVFSSLTDGEAKEIFHTSREKGSAVVTVAVKEQAEFYAGKMTNLGLHSAIEPDQTESTGGS